jgi:hypothetical protein
MQPLETDEMTDRRAIRRKVGNQNDFLANKYFL